MFFNSELLTHLFILHLTLKKIQLHVQLYFRANHWLINAIAENNDHT